MSTPASQSLVPDLDFGPADLSAHNTLGLQSRTATAVTLRGASDVAAIARRAESFDRVLILGGGSNVVLPAEVPGLVIRIANRGIRHVEDTAQACIIEAAAGENWHDFVAQCVAQGRGGLENLALIPGTVGAAPVQNIGAYGVEIKDRLHAVHAWDRQAGQEVWLSAQACDLAYRDSRFKHEPDRWIILAVQFALPHDWTPVLDYPDLQRHAALSSTTHADAHAIFQAVCDIRRMKLPDPAVIGNAGSFFKNPIVDASKFVALRQQWPSLVGYAMPDGRHKLAAGWLIDQCGWKGRRLGRAAVHDRQALVLVNAGGASAADILALSDAIRADVQQTFGVLLEPEPIIVQP